MKFSFETMIYKTGINACVDVPDRITAKMKADRGYIPIKGKIGKYGFEQTLVPVKNAEYRLFVNGLMLKGSGTCVGDRVRFSIEQNFAPRTDITMPVELQKRLEEEELLSVFNAQTPSRQKEILRYLNYLKTAEALQKNISKVVDNLKKDGPNALLPLKSRA
jgi:hypothetical protein